MADLISQNARRSRTDPEYELMDTGVFDDDRYCGGRGALREGRPGRQSLMVIQVTNVRPDTATLHVLPTAGFRNTWSWTRARPGRPWLRPDDAPGGALAVRGQHPFGTVVELLAGAGPDGTPRPPLFCENETNGRAAVGAARGHRVPEGRHPTTT